MISRYAEVCRSLVRAGRHDLAEMVLAAGGVFARLQWCWQQVLRKQHPDVMLDLIRLSLAWLGHTVEIDDAEDPEAILAEHETELSRQAEWGKHLQWISRQFLAEPDLLDRMPVLIDKKDDLLSLLRKKEYRNLDQHSLASVLDVIEGREPIEPPPQGEILYRYPDGWTVQRLITDEQLEGETSILGHCVGGSHIANYRPIARDGRIWSIRDPQGMPRVTLRINRDKTIAEAQSKGGDFPKRYTGRIMTVIRELLDGSVKDRLKFRDPSLDLKTDLRGADLRYAYLYRANLSEANLSEADLFDADLSGADLTGANLRLADLGDASLRLADLSRADIRGANLSRADIRGADLSRANLSGADLRVADLRDANLTGADLSGAVDLDQAKGLDIVQYDADTKWPAGFRIEDYRGLKTVEAASDGFKPTQGMKEAARRGLELRREFGRGGTAVGVARARDIVSGKNLSPRTIRRMHSYFSRHAVDKKAENWGSVSDPSAGYIAWLLWGGDAGAAFARKHVRTMKAREANE